MGAYVLLNWCFSKNFSNKDSLSKKLSLPKTFGDNNLLLILYFLKKNICSLFMFCYMISEGRVVDAGAGKWSVGVRRYFIVQQYFI